MEKATTGTGERFGVLYIEGLPLRAARECRGAVRTSLRCHASGGPPRPFMAKAKMDAIRPGLRQIRSHRGFE